MGKFNVGTLDVFVRHSEQYFNAVCQATIPEYWEAEVVGISEELLEHFNANNAFVHLRLYGTSQTSHQDAIDDLVDELKKNNLTGKLVIH